MTLIIYLTIFVVGIVTGIIIMLAHYLYWICSEMDRDEPDDKT